VHGPPGIISAPEKQEHHQVIDPFPVQRISQRIEAKENEHENEGEYVQKDQEQPMICIIEFLSPDIKQFQEQGI
jgi:hypothetical protein